MVCKRIYWYIRLMTFLQIRYALEADGYFNTTDYMMKDMQSTNRGK